MDEKEASRMTEVEKLGLLKLFQASVLPLTNNKRYKKQWLVQSFTESKTYTVSLDNSGAYKCSCPVWIFRRQRCKHVERVLLEDEETQIPVTVGVDKYGNGEFDATIYFSSPGWHTHVSLKTIKLSSAVHEELSKGARTDWDDDQLIGLKGRKVGSQIADLQVHRSAKAMRLTDGTVAELSEKLAKVV